MELNPLCFSCIDINAEVIVPESRRKFRDAEQKLCQLRAAKSEMEKYPHLFDEEDIEKIAEIVTIAEHSVKREADTLTKISERLGVASAFAEQVNARHEAVKRIRRLIGVGVLSNYFEEKQVRLALLAEEMLKEAIKEI